MEGVTPLTTLPKLLPKPNLKIDGSVATEPFLSVGRNNRSPTPSSSDRHSSPLTADSLNRRRNAYRPNAYRRGREDSPPSKRRTLENVFGGGDCGDVVELSGQDVAEEEEEEVEDFIIDETIEDSPVDEESEHVNGYQDSNPSGATPIVDSQGKTVYYMMVKDVQESRKVDGGERQDIIVKMPRATLSPNPKDKKNSPEAAARKTPRPIKPATGSHQKASGAAAKTPVKGRLPLDAVCVIETSFGQPMLWG